jgi:transcription antitermination factor NusG
MALVTVCHTSVPGCLPWYAVHVHHQFEQIATAALRSRGYEEYVPLVRTRRRWSDRVREIQVPLFPGYVFCRLDPVHRVPVLECPGVVDVLAFGGRPAPIPDSEIAAVRIMVDSALPIFPHPFLKTGQTIRIVRGPLTGVEGIVVEVKKAFRLVASVSLLQRSVSVEIDREWVTPTA